MLLARLSVGGSALVWCLAMVLSPGMPLGAQGTPKATASALLIEDVIVSVSGRGDAPAKTLAPGTLCALRVRLKNAGTQKAGYFTFSVKINGAEVPNYANQLYAVTVDPGAAGEVALYNFYAPDTAARAGKVTVEVVLRSAQWMTVKAEGGTQTWTATGPVGGLPVTKAVAVPVAAS